MRPPSPFSLAGVFLALLFLGGDLAESAFLFLVPFRGMFYTSTHCAMV